ncbi:hypothetical protein ACB087_16995 [Vibrio sp. VNB-15]
MNDEYIKELHLNPNHTYKRISSEWKQKHGDDFDLYTYEEYDLNGELVRTFTVRDSTRMYPPFNRTISFA